MVKTSFRPTGFGPTIQLATGVQVYKKNLIYLFCVCDLGLASTPAREMSAASRGLPGTVTI